MVVISVLMCGCLRVPPPPVPDNRVAFKIADVNFAGDWSHLSNHLKTYHLSYGSFHLETLPNNLNLYSSVKFLSDGITPTLPDLDTKNYHVFNFDNNNYFHARFLDEWGDPAIIDIVDNFGIVMAKGTTNDITITHDTSGIPGQTVSFDFTVDEKGAIRDQTGIINYESNVRWIKLSETFLPYWDDENINIAVLANGYRSDQMEWFRAYAEYALGAAGATLKSQSPLLAQYWDDVNICVIESVSPQAGQGGTVLDILDFDIFEKKFPTSFVLDMIMAASFDSDDYPNELQADNINLNIILVNDDDIKSAESYANFDYPTMAGTTCTIVIPAPVGYDSDDSWYVKTGDLAKYLVWWEDRIAEYENWR